MPENVTRDQVLATATQLVEWLYHAPTIPFNPYGGVKIMNTTSAQYRDQADHSEMVKAHSEVNRMVSVWEEVFRSLPGASFQVVDTESRNRHYTVEYALNPAVAYSWTFIHQGAAGTGFLTPGGVVGAYTNLTGDTQPDTVEEETGILETFKRENGNGKEQT